MPEHYVIVEGLTLPARLSGHPALDFCNTLAGWDGQAQREYLQSYEHLAVWAGFAGVLGPARAASLQNQADRRAKAARDLLSETKAVRARMYAALLHPDDGAAFAAFARDVHLAAGRLRLRRADGSVQWEIESSAGLAAPTLAAVWSASQLLFSNDRRRVRACPGPGCGWLFLDRTGRRRWCAMATCGNRAKARRFASRRQDPGTRETPS
jgi:predicted RNA-binding Zn ribbon-like protein